jgi:hypothetical protein
MKSYNSQYRAENKQKLSALRAEIETCLCGASYSHANKSRHEKSKRHREYMRIKKLKQCLVDGLSYSETKEALKDL